ncbi:biotin--[acetyl-CoA-carboxylase] ligase [Lichenihabitans sp. PAMC28606]|uniref:biotin--[acetyl-CoA-carboxylase] ligase n=1 Tax=Lichenihabitans sp. PAMC28606 TaxID=2880932 RepID=UPI001D0B21D0|nr:biotin--[acetyl-CoA-carboxylase] ligase [Lichenihabitans sp. PAMC28606]UDL95148.1 biotin--[acetyl-CoA-carboxylase] ligase [Lichenihabitans sp. PAMC28606]
MKLADQAIRAGYRINSFETLGSTNDEAMARAHRGDRGKLWIVASRQTGGRGRQGRSWTSPPGNVYASLLLIDPVPQVLAPQLGLLAGVALMDALSLFVATDQPIAIKWPNDIVHASAKLAGILVEGARCRDGSFACVLGFGINRQSHPSDLPYAATDLFSVSAERPSVDDVVSALSLSLDQALTLWDRGRGFLHIRSRWLERALPAGTRMSVASKSHKLDGLFETIDDQGRLVLQTSDGQKTVDAGDVFLMDQPVPKIG